MKKLLTLMLILATVSFAVPLRPAQEHHADPRTYAPIEEVTTEGHGLECTCDGETAECTGDCTHCTCEDVCDDASTVTDETAETETE